MTLAAVPALLDDARVADPGLNGTVDTVINPFGYEGYGNIPELAFVAFQLTFAVITVALISGAIADRVEGRATNDSIQHRTAARVVRGDHRAVRLG